MKVPGREDDWLKQYEKEMLEQAGRTRETTMAEAAAKEGQEALEKLRAAHWLKCQKCGHDMKITAFEDIEVEICSYCMGVYFDRGEIETLLLRKTPQRFTFYRKFFGLD